MINTENDPTDDWRATPSRSPKRHELKCWPPYFAAILSGEKRFEIRRDDRGFRAGDTLYLREYVKIDDVYTGRTIVVAVTYLIGGAVMGIERGFVVMSIAPFYGAAEVPLSLGSNDGDRFRALLTCTVCGHVILTGPWTTGDRAMAAYNLGRAPANGCNAVREHLQVAGHALTVTFETPTAAAQAEGRAGRARPASG